MATVFLALGSNIGNRKENLRRAVELLQGIGLIVQRISSTYETEPVDYLDQDWFLNSVVQAQTKLPPIDLLNAMRAIESEMGSKKAFPKGPRLIDLDLLLYENQTIATPDLQVPHPRMLDRKFVMVPLVEISPELRHPSWNATAAEILKNSTDRSAVRKVNS